ncbi:uridine phosphorylase [Pseudobacteriovorax antillogorgiicola]|uniref:Uridine phosphorylase n=1 Tax=Pseudobacteriovorax antillogorgiicola TaxID=1513793 RepID=A0A1Y6CDJ1_9BACT|nr:uridine phosphorylase [Pseudobacteriovorax antillogorgiicola]TCS47963.1 uridine phosphorylase [Pseudobacteriovorax antillogorgiicola]SMF58191.1 uridine phosphorylase [Pseudobacteriovorax antillogorgiicola]
MAHKAFHLNISKDQLNGATTVILPGDPGRTPKIAQHLDEAEAVSFNREYNIMVGSLDGETICICSTGIGGPSTAIAIEELAMMGVTKFLRVGTTGAIQRQINPGDLIISTGAVRMDGASSHIAPLEFPAVADYRMIDNLVKAAKDLGYNYHTGVTASSDTFYQGQNRQDSFKNGFVIKQFKDKIAELEQLNVMSFEMEAATVLTQTAAYGLQGACVLGVLVNRQHKETPEGEVLGQAQERSIRAAVKSLQYK